MRTLEGAKHKKGGATHEVAEVKHMRRDLLRLNGIPGVHSGGRPMEWRRPLSTASTNHFTTSATDTSTVKTTRARDVGRKLHQIMLKVANALMYGRALLGVLMPCALYHGFDGGGKVGSKSFTLTSSYTFFDGFPVWALSVRLHH
jgi:hypothetical protein